MKPNLLMLALGSACAFILPYVIASSWQAFNTFSHIEYGVWAKPVPDTREKTFIFFGGLALKIKFSIKGNDRNKKVYRSHAPLDKSIGDFFNQFLLIQRNNNKLEISIEKAGGSQPIDSLKVGDIIKVIITYLGHSKIIVERKS